MLKARLFTYIFQKYNSKFRFRHFKLSPLQLISRTHLAHNFKATEASPCMLKDVVIIKRLEQQGQSYIKQKNLKRSSCHTAQKMKFSIKDFFSKCDHIRSILWIWSQLLKKSLMKNFIFCAV